MRCRTAWRNWSRTSPTRQRTSPKVAALRLRAWGRLQRGNGPGTLPPWVLDHCRRVEALAAAMCSLAEAKGLTVDRAVVQAGALLHDIGRSVTQDVRHACMGADLLRHDEPGWPDAVVLCVERHTGGGIDPAEAIALGLPVRDYTPYSLEERIVCHADNLYSGSKRIGLEELEEKYRAKGLAQAWLKIDALHDVLCSQLGADLQAVEPAKLPEP